MTPTGGGLLTFPLLARLAAAVEGTSRFSCQILLSEELDGLVVCISAVSHDEQAF